MLEVLAPTETTAEPAPSPTTDPTAMEQLSSKEHFLETQGSSEESPGTPDCVEDCAEARAGNTVEDDQEHIETSYLVVGLVVGLSGVFVIGVTLAVKRHRHEQAVLTGAFPELLSDEGEAFE